MLKPPSPQRWSCGPRSRRTAVVCPIIDVISDDTFEYMAGSDMTYGGFNWKLNFRWYPVPQREMDRRKGDRTLPVRQGGDWGACSGRKNTRGCPDCGLSEGIWMK